MSFLFRMVLTVLALVLAPASLARLADVSEAGAKRLKHEIACSVIERGEYLCEFVVEIEILNESAREQYSKLRRVYNPRTTRFRLIEAAVRNGKKREEVSPEDVVDQETSLKQSGFDRLRRVTVAFPNVKVGSVVSYTYHFEVFQSAVDGHFSMVFTFGDEILDAGTRIRITSRLPLYYHLHDPHNAVKLERQLTPKLQRLFLETKKPLFRSVVEEENAFDEQLDLTTFEVSTSDDPADIGRKIGAKFAAKMDNEGSVLAMLGLEAERFKSSIPPETFDAVTAVLSERFRYFGDWRALDGAYAPRSLKEIVSKGYGDCKDLALLLTAVLRELGYEAHAAAVFRSSELIRPRKLVHLSEYNHAVVRVRHRGKDYWLDPTNKESFSTGIPDDIAGRPALILDPVAAREVWIDDLTPERNQFSVRHDIVASLDGLTTVDATLNVTGVFAALFTALELSESREQAEQTVAESLGQGKRILEVTRSEFELKSQVVQSQTMFATLSVADYFIESDRGPILRLNNFIGGSLLSINPRDRVSAYKLSLPSLISVRIRTARPDHMNKIGNRCTADSRWLRFERRVIKDEGTIEFVTETTVKVGAIPAVDLKGEEFRAFQGELRKCALPDAVVLE